MKKLCFLLLIFASILSLTSCTVNWFGETADVPWYYVVIPIILVTVITYASILSKTYVCPKCKMEFKVKPHQLYVTLHMGGKRMAKCPHCGRKGFCDIKRSTRR